MSHDVNSRLNDALTACRNGFVAIGTFSLGVNLLMLTAPLFMLQLFDRVLTSRSTDTLFVLVIIAAVALIVMTILDILRGAMLTRLGTWLEWRLAGTVLSADIIANLRDGIQRADQGLHDLAAIRGALSGQALYPVLDAPWTPIFLAVMFLLHPTLGWISTGGALILLVLAVLNERWSRHNMPKTADSFAKAQASADDAVRNADAIEAMGMMQNFMASWHPGFSNALFAQQGSAQVSVLIASASKLVRLFLQIGLLSAGAWLVLLNEIGPGAMIAGSILISRALAPVEQALGSWKTVAGARRSYARLSRQLAGAPGEKEFMPLPNPTGEIALEGVRYRYPEAEKPAISNCPSSKSLGQLMA